MNRASRCIVATLVSGILIWLSRRLHTQVFDLEVRQGVPLAVVFTRACPCIPIRSAFPVKDLTFYHRLEAHDIHTHTDVIVD